jgi:hypothetical protein
MLMEHFQTPRSLKDFKIQQNEQNSTQNQTNLFKVRLDELETENIYERVFDLWVF